MANNTIYMLCFYSPIYLYTNVEDWHHDLET